MTFGIILISSIIIIALLYFIFTFWKKITDRRLRKKYNAEEDLSRKGEERRRTGYDFRRRKPEFEESDSSIEGQDDSSRRRSMEATMSDALGKDSHRSRGFFKRVRRR